MVHYSTPRARFPSTSSYNVTTIRKLRGILKRKPGDKPFAEEWAEHKREEKELEESKYARSTGSR